MPRTLDAEIAQALAPLAAALAGQASPPVGDVAARRIDVLAAL